MKLVFFTTLFIMGMVFLLPALLSLLIKDVAGNIQPALHQTLKIYAGSNATEVILAKDNNFSGIGASFKNPQLVNKKDIILSVYDQNNQLIRTSLKNGAYISDGGFVKFLFPPIPDSVNHSLKFIFTSPQSSYNDALEIFLTNIQDSSEIAWVSFYKPLHPWQNTQIVYANWINHLTSDPIFLIIYLATIIGGFVYLVKVKLN